MSIRDGGHWGLSQKLLTTPSHRRGNEGQSIRHSLGVGSSSGVVDQGSLRGFPNRHHGPPDPVKVMGLGLLGVPAHSPVNIGAIRRFFVGLGFRRQDGLEDEDLHSSDAGDLTGPGEGLAQLVIEDRSPLESWLPTDVHTGPEASLLRV